MLNVAPVLPQPEVPPVGNKKWGPVQPARKSSRTNVGGKTIMEIAVEKQKEKNLEIPKATRAGNRNFNPFSVLQDPEVITIAETVGVKIPGAPFPSVGFRNSEAVPLGTSKTSHPSITVSPSVTLPRTSVALKPVPDPSSSTLESNACSFSEDSEDELELSPPSTPVGLKGIPNAFADHSMLWSKVSKYGQGKHPRKSGSK